MDHNRLIKLFDKEKLAEIVMRKDKEIEYYKKKVENQQNLGKVFFEGKYYWIIFEEVKQ